MRRCLHIFLITILQVNVLPIIAQEIKRPPLIGIAFVELQVSDIKKAESFYHSLLGYTTLPGTDKLHSFYVNLNARQSIKVKDGLPANHDERMLSLAFQTTNAATLRLYLQSKGIDVPAVLNKESDGLLWFQVIDPDKHPVKFVQFPASAKGQPQNTVSQKAISSRILHAGLTIASAAKADAFYKDILGFSETWRGGATDSATSWINMHVPESTDYIEYMLVNSPVNRQQLGGLHHIALLVPDMQQALDALNSRAGAWLIAAPRIGRNRRWQLNLYDPDGTRIELMEPFPMK